MGKIKIVADSTCDLSKELIEENSIEIIPLCIVLNDESLYDGEEITPDDIYKWVSENGKTPKTAALTTDYATRVLEACKAEDADVLFFGISEDMSTTCNVMRLMADDLDYSDRVHVINSMNLSTGIGLQVLAACDMVKLGYSIDEIEKTINSRRGKVRASFVVDTLEYLAKGGRCSAVTALLATALKLKPRIEVNDGKMGVGKKYRGKQKSVIVSYANDMREDLLKADNKRVFITHSGCDDEVIKQVKDYLEELNYFEQIIVTRAGGVISSHCGPNTLGVLFYEQ